MSISIAMVALGDGARISAKAVRQDLAATWPDLPATSKAQKTDGTLAFRVGDADVVLGVMPAPIPWSDLEGPCATSWLWRDAADALRKHRTHVIVTVRKDGEPVERLKLLTQVTAALVATCDAALGVYWRDARLVVSPELFRDFAVKMLPDSLPLYVWIDFRIGTHEGNTAGFTTGMAALGHRELETLDAPESPAALRDRLVGLVHYLIENGPVIRDGETVGEDVDERIRVVYSPSAFGHEGQVMRLEFTEPRENIFWMDGEEPKMVAAMQRARATFRRFRQALERRAGRRAAPLDDAAVKVFFSDPHDPESGEHMWVNEIRFHGKRMTGILCNDPDGVPDLSCGDEVSFTEDRVSDWYYVAAGVAQGGYTIKLLLKQMSEQEYEMYRDDPPVVWFAEWYERECRGG